MGSWFLDIEQWALFVIGLLLGSFLNVVAYRVPRRESIVSPSSHCPHCNKELQTWQLIPVVSWIILRGKCHACHESISIRYPLLELLVSVLFMLTSIVGSSWQQCIAWCILWLLLVATIGTDLTAMKVPNVLSLPGFAICFAASAVTGVQTWQGALYGSLTGFGMLLFLHFISGGHMGLGDAKLYLSIGAFLGPALSVESFILASFAGAVVGGGMRLFGLLNRREYMPFVPHIAIGVIVVVFYGDKLNAWYIHHVLGL